jgi:hypothetical protein
MNEEEKKEVKEEIKSEFLEKEKSDKEKAKWLNYLSITTILFSLCATLSAFNGGNYGGKSMSSQIKASDQWAFYQSKSIKQYLYEIQIDNLHTQLLTMQPGMVYDSTKKHLDNYAKNVVKYKADKDTISSVAKGLEAIRDDAQKHGKPFGLAVVFLQVSILLSAIAALIKKKVIWYISMAPGFIGVIYFVNGFLLFF